MGNDTRSVQQIIDEMAMNPRAMLESVQFVVGQDGRPTAVQIGIETWHALLDWLEEAEDRTMVKAAIPKLRLGPQAAGALRCARERSGVSGMTRRRSDAGPTTQIRPCTFLNGTRIFTGFAHGFS